MIETTLETGWFFLVAKRVDNETSSVHILVIAFNDFRYIIDIVLRYYTLSV